MEYETHPEDVHPREDASVSLSAALREANEREKTVNSPGDGTKFDTDKLPVGLIPWNASLVDALRDSVLPHDADEQLAEQISKGEFLQALTSLFLSERISIDSVIKVLQGGAGRYGYFNWKGLDPLRLYNAAIRHALRIGKPDWDAHHDDQVACCLLFLCHFNWQPVQNDGG